MNRSRGLSTLILTMMVAASPACGGGKIGAGHSSGGAGGLSTGGGTVDSGAGAIGGSTAGAGGAAGAMAVDGAAGRAGIGGAAGSLGGGGAGGQTGIGGTAGSCGGGHLTATEATTLYRRYAFEVQPDLNPTVTFEVSELDVAGLWEGLNVQLFQVIGRGEGGSFFRECTVLTHACQVFLPADDCVSFTSQLSSGRVVNGAFYFSWGSGSGVFRSRLGKLVPNGAQFTRSVSPEYFNANLAPPPLALQVSGADIFVHRAAHAFEFNGEFAAEKLGKLKDLGDALVIVDDSGNPIATTLP